MKYYRKVNDDVYNIGGNDRRLSRFENMFSLPQGICYNAYVLLDDDKTVLFDGIDISVSERYYRDLAAVLDGRKLDYFVVHHVEPDHCSSILGVMRQYPEATMLITAPGLKFLKQFYHVDLSERSKTVKDGEMLELGRHKLQFFHTPNVHWPEVMMTFDHYDKALYSADAFGSFKAPEGHMFADQVNYERDWLAESRRYYFNIVGKQGPFVQRTFTKFQKEKLDIQAIHPLHGLIFRTPETISMILDKYNTWSSYTPEEPGVCLVYGSLYGNTMEATDALADELAVQGVKNIRVYDVSDTERSFIVADLFRFSHAVFACPTYNTELFPEMDALLRDIIALGWQNRTVAYMENRTWGGKALKIAQDIVNSGKDMKTVGDSVGFMSSVGDEEVPDLEALAKIIAEDVNKV